MLYSSLSKTIGLVRRSISFRKDPLKGSSSNSPSSLCVMKQLPLSSMVIDHWLYYFNPLSESGSRLTQRHSFQLYLISRIRYRDYNKIRWISIFPLRLVLILLRLTRCVFLLIVKCLRHIFVIRLHVNAKIAINCVK
jgi:hypothetical protein